MKDTLFTVCRTLAVAVLVGLSPKGLSQPVLPLEFDAFSSMVNYSTLGELPLGPNAPQPLEPTPGQFGGVLNFGGIVAPTNSFVRGNSSYINGNNPFSAKMAEEMQLPMALLNSGEYAILREAYISGTYFARGTSHRFGQVIQPPTSDEFGETLNILNSNYWNMEPYAEPETDHDGYYWSPHSRRVYASQSGPVRITWRKVRSDADNSGYINPGDPDRNVAVINGLEYRLYTKAYIVSGSPVQTPRRMYWTEKQFRNLGWQVILPSSRVSGVQIVYNQRLFPRTVEQEYRGPGYTDPTDGQNTGDNAIVPLRELRTLWFDQEQGMLSAYNQEGRVLIELLGDPRADGRSHESLGIEIVDVHKQPMPIDLTVDLGEMLVPPVGSARELEPRAVVQFGSAMFAYEHQDAQSGHKQLYAEQVTRNPNDLLVHWLETGNQGIQWPTTMGRYRLQWPADEQKYSHYIRPLVDSKEEALATAVQLPTANVPFIAFQDVDSNDTEFADLTPDYRFYTFLTPEFPAHRTLLRMASGAHLAYERVFSWLDQSVIDLNQELADTESHPLLAAMNEYRRRLIAGEEIRTWEVFYLQTYHPDVDPDDPIAMAAVTAEREALLSAYRAYFAGLGSVINSVRGVRDFTDYPDALLEEYPQRVIAENQRYQAELAAYQAYLQYLEDTAAYEAASEEYQESMNAYFDLQAELEEYLGYLSALEEYEQALATYDDEYAAYEVLLGEAEAAYQVALAEYQDQLALYNALPKIGTTAYDMPPNSVVGHNGTWYLYVEDHAASDVGSLNSWELIFDYVHNGIPGTRTFHNNVPMQIPTSPNTMGHASIYPHSIFVHDIPGRVTDVRVRLIGLSHTYPGDLSVWLASPEHNAVCLLNRNGGANSISNIDILFRQGSQYPLPGSPLVATTYRPNGSTTTESRPSDSLGLTRVSTLTDLLTPVPSGHLVAYDLVRADAATLLPVGGTSPPGEELDKAFDDNPNTKYLNFGTPNNTGQNSGFIVGLGTHGAFARGLLLTSANDTPNRDPQTYRIEGSNDQSIWTTLATGSVPDFQYRFQTKRIEFPSSAWAAPYLFFRVVFPLNHGGNSMQLSEIHLLGMHGLPIPQPVPPPGDWSITIPPPMVPVQPGFVAMPDPQGLADVIQPGDPAVNDLPAGLALYLPFDTDFMDASGRGNHGTPVGPTESDLPSITQTESLTPGGGSLRLGSGQSVALGRPDDLLFGSQVHFSVSFWVKRGSGGWSGDPAFISNKDWTSGANTGFVVAGRSDGGWRWNFKGASQPRVDYQDSDPLSQSDWTHITVTHHRQGNANLYRNGVLVSSHDIAGHGIINALDWNIGTDGTGNYVHSFNELYLDDLAVWRRELSPQEVTLLYQKGSGFGGAPRLSVGTLDLSPGVNGFAATETGALAETVSTESHLGVSRALDRNPETKYVNNRGAGSGLVVWPSLGPTLILGITITTAPDNPGSDPASFTLEGSTNGVDFIPIYGGEIPVQTERSIRHSFSFYNHTPYLAYRVLFPELADPSATEMQVSGVELHGVRGEPIIPPASVADAPPPTPPNPGFPPGEPQLWLDALAAPRLVSQTVYVGRRITPPVGEIGDDGSFVGHINTSVGNLFHPDAYKDPLVHGIPLANTGAIIPVNAIPGENELEVWWFRTSQTMAGPNAGNLQLGFQPIYWPSMIGRYTLEWPPNDRQIVLASNLGTGTLSSHEAMGSIYGQNDRTAPGYNPNEEHAIMAGGTGYATRDDLNRTSPGDYSSHPYVLVQYTAMDGRPAVSTFQVVREKPEEGWVFDYITSAGTLLQAPMPLPLLAKPVVGSGDYAENKNYEVAREEADFPGGWTDVDDEVREFYGHYRAFTWVDRQKNTWVYRGPHDGIPELAAGRYNEATESFEELPEAVWVLDEPFTYTVHASRQSDYLALLVPEDLPDWVRVQGLSLIGVPPAAGNYNWALRVVDLYDGSEVPLSLSAEVVGSGTPSSLAPLWITSNNPYTGTSVVFQNRPPFLAADPTGENSFSMRFYYKTEPTFHWPGFNNPPPPGSIVPYLRPVDPDTGAFVGDAGSMNTAALDVVYRPVWPVRDPRDSSKPVPTLPFAATLIKPQHGMPGVGDMITAELLYQQSIGLDLVKENPSAVLFDPTREKQADLLAAELAALPGGIVTDIFMGLSYFPALPPHLSERLFFDPNRGSNGSLVFKGSFVEEILGESYVLLNVLRGSDLERVLNLCPEADPDRSKWESLVNSLQTTMETFHEDPNRPGTFVPNADWDVAISLGDLAAVHFGNTAVDSYAISASGPGSGYITLVESGGSAFTQPGDPVALHIFRVGGDQLYVGEVKPLTSSNPLNELITFQHTADLAGMFDDYEYEWKMAAPVEGLPPNPDPEMSQYISLESGLDIPRVTLGGAGIQALTDNYVVMRYRSRDEDHPLFNQWSEWTAPKLAEGWIKRVLAGINPFNQRITDFFNNEVDTSGSMLTQAGRRWEGDIALNLDTINNYGLIEIYETVLRRGRLLSIEAGYNYGPANDALMLAAGYINDLYMMLGGEAWADASNPTIGIGTKDSTYGDVATALFAFKGQVASLLEEELALLRGRDDFLLPGVEVVPVYNRLIWNYTRGINSGEVIYALNYNIQENPNRASDGIVGPEDAAHMFPQGHGDAYGHYLTALKGYYSLWINPNFDWVPRIEAVNILGQPVSVDYMDERKFAAAAAAVARTGLQVFDLTWRENYKPVSEVGWAHFSTSRTNRFREYQLPGGAKRSTVRHWGKDHWASRVGVGAYVHWAVANSLLPAVETNPEKQGIQKIDRTTVPELRELVGLAQALQTSMDNAEGGLSPLGVPESGIAFDINPSAVVGQNEGTHFEQVYNRAKVALRNAVESFDDAKHMTQLMRSEQDSLVDLQEGVANQERAFNNRLIELYGTPYPEDIGPGKLYRQGYRGPDLLHYMYVDLPEIQFDPSAGPAQATTYKLDIQDVPEDWLENHYTTFDFIVQSDSSTYTLNRDYIEYHLQPHGFFGKPSNWTGRRQSPGRIQQAISEWIVAHTRLQDKLDEAEGAKADLDKAIRLFRADVRDSERLRGYERDLLIAEQTLSSIEYAFELFDVFQERTKNSITMGFKAGTEAIPTAFIAGMAAGGDLTSGARAALQNAGWAITEVLDWVKILKFVGITSFGFANETAERWLQFDVMAPIEWEMEMRGAVMDLADALGDVQSVIGELNLLVRAYDDGQRNYRAMVAEGDRIQEERMVFRRRAAALVQGFRTRDAAFRLFRDEKLERYKTLFDLAARYSLLAANAYDYETGLLGTPEGRDFRGRIVASRALGVVRNGEPLFAGSNTGDPGLSSVLAEMRADWDVLRGRLGFNNPDAYGTTVSLRTEAYRILPTSDGDTAWSDLLHAARTSNLLLDPDVRRYCMQIDTDGGLPVPGIVLTFSTTVADGLNVFGRELAGGDHSFSSSSFATKIFGVGAALIGYRGMDNPTSNAGAVSGAGGTSAAEPGSWFLDSLALSATPGIYLIPVGLDSMRSPPLGDTSRIRTWRVEDVAIPMPFNVGASDFSNFAIWQSADALTEPLFTVRKHQAFRPVSSTAAFSPSLYGSNGSLQRSQFTNNRLVGRSVWNSQWKLVIPGKNLLNNPNEGLDRFIQTVTDIQLHFVTYSYSGN